MKKLKKLTNSNAVGLLMFAVVIALLVSIKTPAILTTKSISNMMKTTGLFAAVAMSQLVVLSIGQFTLSLGAIGCLSAVSFAWVMEDFGFSTPMCILVCVGMGLLLGLIHGEVTARTGLNAFVVTLAFQNIYNGVATALLNGRWFEYMPDAIININKKGLFYVEKYPMIPWILIIAIAIVALIWLFYRKTSLGHKLLLVGDSPKAADIAGIKSKSIIAFTYTLSGGLAALAAILACSRYGSAPLALGSDWITYSLAGPVLGGTLLSGGKVDLFGALAGSLLLQVINYSLSFLGVDAFWMQTALGLVLTAAFSVDYIRGYIAKRAALKEARLQFGREAAGEVK